MSTTNSCCTVVIRTEAIYLLFSHRKQIQPLLGQFSKAEALLISSGVEPGTLDGVLLDAGCSSMQFDTPERGFSLQKDGPLDMRMDSDRYLSIKYFSLKLKKSVLSNICTFRFPLKGRILVIKPHLILPKCTVCLLPQSFFSLNT